MAVITYLMISLGPWESLMRNFQRTQKSNIPGGREENPNTHDPELQVRSQMVSANS